MKDKKVRKSKVLSSTSSILYKVPKRYTSKTLMSSDKPTKSKEPRCKYEYLKVGFLEVSEGHSIQTSRLNELGKKGWKLVTITNWNTNPAFLYFVRELV